MLEQTQAEDNAASKGQHAKSIGTDEIRGLLQDRHNRLGALQKHAKRPKDKSKDTLVKSLSEDVAKLEGILQTRRIYQFLSEPEPGDSVPELDQADLSLIISLKLDGSPPIDVARFGDYARTE
jgi:hypothetical protein